VSPFEHLILKSELIDRYAERAGTDLYFLPQLALRRRRSHSSTDPRQ
jgi:hypothetical protein